MRIFSLSASRRHFFKQCSGGLLLALGQVPGAWSEAAQARAVLRNIAFFYGEEPDFYALSKYQLVVLEPSGSFVLPRGPDVHTQWLAYVSVGEVTPLRDYYPAIPREWIVGANNEWHSEVIDQGAPGWPAFFVEHVVAPLWARGYTGFFLDTLDSYQLVAKDDADRLRNQRGLIAVIRAISQRFPTAKIIMNRGFELLPDIHSLVYALAFESLFKGWSETRGVYTDVPENDREWLLSQASTARDEYGLPVIAIDYCAPVNIQCARRTVRRIRDERLVPYVGDGHLQVLSFAGLG